jgi:hypothetical protein
LRRIFRRVLKMAKDFIIMMKILNRKEREKLMIGVTKEF